MPHQCVHCGILYGDGDEKILKGCDCGGKLFFFIKKNAVKKVSEINKKLSNEEKKQIEKDIFEIIGYKEGDDKPVILDFEVINILEPGKYEIDLVNLIKKKPLIYKIQDGKYIIDLPETFDVLKEKD